VKAEAPQAPVSQNAKNRKSPGTSHSAALVRGPAKGSALFQQLMSARASRMNGAGYVAEKNAGAQLVPQSDGLKGEHSLAALLKALRAGAPSQKLPEIIPGAQNAAEAMTEKDKLDAARKAAHAKAVAAGIEAQQAAAHPDATQKSAVSAKEQKRDSGEPGKAPTVEARPAASRAEPLIRIVDLRRAEKPHPGADTALSRTADQASSDRDPSTPVSLRLGASREPFVETLSKPASAAGAHAQTPLERLREMAGSELVRASSIVLKDGGGEIKLVLKPESLGSVRIRMNLVDNAIEGRIIVDSSAVKHVFDGSVDALRRALTAEGFQMGSLQVSVGGQDAGADAREQRDQAPAAVRRITAQGFERNVPGVENVSLGDLFVNLFV
jgi:flagellar hook-length control protein FliK